MFEIHELHHHVLFSWQNMREKCPAVISFDHHTDILPAFFRYSEKNGYPADAGRDIASDISRLQHDEHFSYALNYNIISQAFIISHTAATTKAQQNLHVLYDGDFTEDEPLNSDAFRAYSDIALEDSFLERFLPLLPQENYILDIDCDYFKTAKALEPDHCTIFRKLVRNASCITVSREEDWVRLLTFEDSRYFTPEYIIAGLQALFF